MPLDSITIVEVDVAGALSVELAGPDLPYAQPRGQVGFETGGPLEKKTFYLPGRATPIWQVLQARQRDLVFHGAFRDHLAVRDGLSGGGADAFHARSMVAALERIRARANPLRVTWGALSWRCLLTEARFGHESASQIPYELTFEVATAEHDGQTDKPGLGDDNGGNLAAVIGALQADVHARALETTAALAIVAVRDDAVAVQNAMDLADAALQDAADAVDRLERGGASDLLTGVARVVGAGRAGQLALDAVRLAFLVADAVVPPDSAPDARLAWLAAYAGYTDSSVRAADGLRSICAGARSRARSATRLYVAQAGDTLESIARQLLGDASRAGELGLRAAQLAPGVVVRVPQSS